MILAVDIGNTNIVLGAIEGEKILFLERMATDRSATEMEYLVRIRSVLADKCIDLVGLNTRNGARAQIWLDVQGGNQEWKLTRTELNVMLFLYNNPAYDRAADIVSHRGIAKSHVSLSVASLEEKGLLRRRYSELDRRTAHLELLEQGQRIAAQAREKQVQYFSALYRGVSPEELEIWKNITQKVWDNIKKLETAEEFL